MLALEPAQKPREKDSTWKIFSGDYIFLTKNVKNRISGWAFDNDGVMWGVGRNEDGDETGNF